jgi:hypothetical protein
MIIQFWRGQVQQTNSIEESIFQKKYEYEPDLRIFFLLNFILHMCAKHSCSSVPAFEKVKQVESKKVKKVTKSHQHDMQWKDVPIEKKVYRRFFLKLPIKGSTSMI